MNIGLLHNCLLLSIHFVLIFCNHSKSSSQQILPNQIPCIYSSFVIWNWTDSEFLQNFEILDAYTQSHGIHFIFNLHCEIANHCIVYEDFFQGTFWYLSSFRNHNTMHLFSTGLLGNRILHFWLGKHFLQDPYNWYFIWIVCAILDKLTLPRKLKNFWEFVNSSHFTKRDNVLILFTILASKFAISIFEKDFKACCWYHTCIWLLWLL